MSNKDLRNNSINDLYYQVGFISPYVLNGFNKPPKPVCNQNTTCGTKDFSMCRFPNTQYNARLYFDSEWKVMCKCNRYLHKV